MKFHYAVESRFAGGDMLEAHCTNRAAAECLVKALRELRGPGWLFRISPLTGRGKPGDWV
jgi:hypothetical protein